MKHLTKRETEVLSLLAKGLSNVEIAKELVISKHTVKAIIENIYNKLEIHNRILVAIYATKYFENNPIN